MACQNPIQILNKPQTSVNPTSVVQSTPTFVLYGAPVPTTIKGLTGLVQKVRKAGVTTDTSSWPTYFAEDNYKDIPLTTPNILGGDTNTTLRFNNVTYILFFSCLHKAIWSGPTDTAIQLSMVFRSDTHDFYHICIPITVAPDASHESPILKSWFSGSPVSPSGLTLNDLLNFRGSEEAVSYSLLEYCLKYNWSSGNEALTKINNYAFCVFSTPLTISQPTQTNCSWFSNARSWTFDAVFNLFLRGEIHVYMATNVPDPYLVSAETHFGDNVVTQNTIQPAFFKVQTILLSGTVYTSDQLKPKTRGLANVKCYPIDLASQVDANGNIYIDRDTNTPIDTWNVLNDAAHAQQQLPTVNASVSVNDPTTIQTRNIILYICISVIVIAIMVIAIGYIATIVLRSNTVDEAARAAKEAANAAAAKAANAAAEAGRKANAAMGAALNASLISPPVITR